MQGVINIQCVKEKIIKTNEVLKMLLDKKSELETLRVKYQTIVNKYLEKCKQFQQLKEECEGICVYSEERQKKIVVLEEQLKLKESERAQLQAEHNEHVNTSQYKYQMLNQELCTSQSKIEKCEKQILFLEGEVAKAKRKCDRCGKIIKKRKVDLSKKSCPEDTEIEIDEAWREKTLVKTFSVENLYTENEEADKIREEAEAKILSLESKLALATSENFNLKNNIEGAENKCNKLLKDNSVLKTNIKEEKIKNLDLQERVDALRLEVELISSDCNSKSSCDVGIQTAVELISSDCNSKNSCDVGIQTAVELISFDCNSKSSCDVGIQTAFEDCMSDVSSDFAFECCSNLDFTVPRLISPLDYQESPEDFPYSCNLDTPASPDSEIADFVPCNPDDVAKEIDPNSTLSQERLHIIREVDSCIAVVQKNGSDEPDLLGFICAQKPASNSYEIDSNCRTRIKQRRRQKARSRRVLKAHSDAIYRRVLKGVLKYLDCNGRYRGVQNRKKRRRIKKEMQPLSSYKELSSNQPGNTSQTVNMDGNVSDNDTQHTNFSYDMPPSSVDSGYSAQMGTESDNSDSASLDKLDEANESATLDVDLRKRKLDLFGSDDSESESEDSSSIRPCEAIVEIQGNVQEVKRGRLKNEVSRERRCVTEDQNERLVDSDATASNITKDSPMRRFKRPNCRKKVLDLPQPCNQEQSNDKQEKPQQQIVIANRKAQRTTIKFVGQMFNMLFTYPEEPMVSEEVASKLATESEPELILRAMMEALRSDYRNKNDKAESPFAPILTKKQKILLGLLLKLEDLNVSNIIPEFLRETEQCILQEKCIEHIVPLTRLYMAVCKIKKDIHRIRKTCLDALYFMGDLVVPFLFIVLTSWMEVLPMQSESLDSILPKVLVQVINMKTCNVPGYNLINLRSIIERVHGYPKERWNSEELFAELTSAFREDPYKQEIEVAILILCKNHAASWVVSELEKLTHNMLHTKNSVLKTRVAEVIRKVTQQFNSKEDADYLEKLEECLGKLAV